MKRVYGYKRRDGYGKRYQDGFGAGARTDKTPVIDRETLPFLKTVPQAGVPSVVADDEEVELKFGSGVKQVEAVPVEPPKEAAVAVKEEEAKEEPVEETDDTGELPKHFTGFMATDNITPTVGETAPEEMTEPEE